MTEDQTRELDKAEVEAKVSICRLEASLGAEAAYPVTKHLLAVIEAARVAKGGGDGKQA